MNFNQSVFNKVIFHHVSLLAIAIVMTCAATLWQTVTVYSKSDQYAVPCGFPLTFVELDQSNLDPPYPWPAECTFLGTTYSAQYLLLDMVFFYSILLGIIGAVAFMRMKVRGESRSLSELWQNTLAKASALAGILLASGVLLIATFMAMIVFSIPPPLGVGHPIQQPGFLQ